MAGQNSAHSFLSFAQSTLNLQSAAIFLLIFLVVLKLVRRPKNLPPGPRQWPVLGNLPALVRSGKHPHEVLAEWARRYGGVMSVHLAPARGPSVVVSDIGIAKELLQSKQRERHIDRAANPLLKEVTDIRGSFLWGAGEAAKEHRRFGLSALRKLGVGKKNLEHRINEEARYLVERIEAEKNRPFDLNLPIHNAVSNTVCSISFGFRFDYDDPKLKKLLESLVVISKMGIEIWGNKFPFLYHTPFFSKKREWVNFLRGTITQIIQDHQSSYDENDLRDIIDMHIADIKEKEQKGSGVGLGPGLTDVHDEIGLGILDLFAAGTETTASTVLWLISFVLKYPEVQDKIQQEIYEVVGSDRQPSCEDRPSMPYTNAVINEVLRMRPAGAFALPYVTTQEFELRGYTIPKGIGVTINLWAIMNDPKVWDRPEEFNPGRFLSKDGKTMIQHEAFIPFSTGRRSCLGEGLAKTEVFLFATNLFQRFTFKLPPGAPPPALKGICRFTFDPDMLTVCAVKR
ncbi:cytochrome P450 2J3-like isoform X1 [Acanthaster planci]|uniref:Cytochrome P450 2J3-like isoform X1 n=1 Tax=Acanthaster planci TaxID=133434 RepID=A0A8B7Y2X6_ACAPL|nr:cytochrome P450 2J3-like isoform X1 [Acanthaster planci]